MGLELLDQKVAQLLNRESFHLGCAQAGEVDDAVRADREASAQLRDVEQLALQALPRAKDVAVVGVLVSRLNQMMFGVNLVDRWIRLF